MNKTIEELFKRQSIRAYLDKEITEEEKKSLKEKLQIAKENTDKWAEKHPIAGYPVRHPVITNIVTLLVIVFVMGCVNGCSTDAVTEVIMSSGGAL